MCVCRFHKLRSELKARDGAESRESKQPKSRKKTEIRAQVTNPAASKSSVLQSIYGENIGFYIKTLFAFSSGIMFMMTCLFSNTITD